MGASDSKLVFKKGIFRLSEERHIPADDPYWTSVRIYSYLFSSFSSCVFPVFFCLFLLFFFFVFPMLSHPSLFQGSGDGPNVNQCQLILTNNAILVLGTSRVVRGCLQPLRTRRYSTNSRSSTRESRNSYPRRHLPPIHLTASSLLPRSRSCTRARRPKLHSHLDTHPALLV